MIYQIHIWANNNINLSTLIKNLKILIHFKIMKILKIKDFFYEKQFKFIHINETSFNQNMRNFYGWALKN